MTAANLCADFACAGIWRADSCRPCMLLSGSRAFVFMGTPFQHAVSAGATELWLGLGGSATNDAGLGALQVPLGFFVSDVCAVGEMTTHGRMQALGLELLRDDGTVISEPACGRHLSSVKALRGQYPLLPANLSIQIATDVDSLFLGPMGAVAVFSTQKGATTMEMRAALEMGMESCADAFLTWSGVSVRELAGSGAAGGTAGGLVAGIRASIVSVCCNCACKRAGVQLISCLGTGIRCFGDNARPTS